MKKLIADCVQECQQTFRREYFVFPFAIKNINIPKYRPEVLAIVLCGCETWSLTSREEQRLKVF